jgi:hypothetical protein
VITIRLSIGHYPRWRLIRSPEARPVSRLGSDQGGATLVVGIN